MLLMVYHQEYKLREQKKNRIVIQRGFRNSHTSTLITTHGDQENPITHLDPIASEIVILTILNEKPRRTTRPGVQILKKLECLYHFGEWTIITSNIISMSYVPLANKRVRRC
jgi:hypothetical protein